MMNNYQSILQGIFLCGEQDVCNVVANEEAKIVIDLRAEASESAAEPGTAQWIHIPLEGGKPNQAALIKEAIQHVVAAYNEGKRAVVH